MNEALSDARNVMVLAISSGVPTRLSGTVAARLAFLSAVPVKRFSIPVSTGPGENHVNPYPRFGGFERGRLSESFNCMLARCVYGRAGSASMTVRRRNVDDASTSLGKHHAQLMLHAEQRAQDVCVEGRGIGFRGLFRHRTGFALSSSAIDSNIQMTKARDGLIHQIPHVMFIPDVGRNKNRLRSEPC